MPRLAEMPDGRTAWLCGPCWAVVPAGTRGGMTFNATPATPSCGHAEA